MSKKTKMNRKYNLSDFVAYDKTDPRSCTYSTSDCHYLWFIGATNDSRLYVNEICYGESEISKAELREIIGLFDYVIILPLGVNAFDIAKTIQEELDSGKNIGEVFSSIENLKSL